VLQDKKFDTKKIGILVACFWSLVLFFSLYTNIVQKYKTVEKQAALVARANLDRDRAVRQWVSDRGGVYAKINELTQPSPYLAHIPTRDIHTPVGDLTLLNPAYILRLMMDEHELLYGIKGRIVGLKALRPENIADDWEKNAISQFEADRELKDYTEFDVINGESYIRMMVPMYMTPDCMKCHAVLGYKVGDLRGGVNISVPLRDYYALAKEGSIYLGFAHGGIWLLGLFGIGFVTKRSVKAEKLRSRDIQELKETEKALLKSEARLNEAQRLAKVGAWELDLLTNELIWTDEIFRIFEIDKNKFQASYEGFLNTIHPKDRGMVDKAYTDSLIDKEPYEITHRLKMSDGRVKYVHEKCKSYFDHDGKAVRSVGTVHEITERKKTEQELARVQGMLEQANKVAKMGAWSFDLISNELVWSDVTKEIHEVGMDYKPVIEEGINFYKEGIHRDTMSRIVTDAIQNGGPWDEELIIVTANGNEKWVRAMGQPEFKDGACIRLYGSFQDITERKQNEVELQKYRHQLEEVVEERTKELTKSLAEKEVLLKEVHHRVKNNMAMVSAFIQLQMNGADDVYSLGALGACESRIQAMSMVHKRLYQSDDFTSIDMKILFDEISGALFKKSDFDNIELDIQANDISLEMDAAIPCAMIINELLSNSLKYAFKDGQPGKISVCMDVIKGGMYCLCVSDTGVGLSEDIFMGEADTLGLQLVNVFVDQLSGELEVHQKDGVTFKIVFPAGKTTNV
jgi:two-component sensor histidine kinase